MRVDASAQAAATQAVSRAAQATGADFGLLLATAKRESGLNQSAHASTSSATGLFQFVDTTWMNLVARYGAKHGLNVDTSDPRQRQSILDLRLNPEVSALMAGELTRENAAALAAKLGRAATPSELYAAHVLGPAKAAELINAAANGQGNAAALDPRAANANRNLFFNADGASLSAADVLAKLQLAPDSAAPVQEAANDAPVASARPRLSVGTLMSFLSPANWTAQAGPDLWSLALRAYTRDGEERTPQSRLGREADET